jgi:hypothetical protein
MTLIQKISLDGVENMDLFFMLTDERNTDIPPSKVLGKKVCEDCSVSTSLVLFHHLILFIYNEFIECVLVSK